MEKVVAVVLAGGKGAKLWPLSAKRPDAAIPFLGKYRGIDVVLSNCVRSGITDIGVALQYRYHSLVRHLKHGEPWE